MGSAGRGMVRGVDRAAREVWLRERREWEDRLLDEWCKRSELLRLAEERRDGLVAGKEAAVLKVLGMTAAERRAAVRARAGGGGRRPSDAMSDRRTRLVYRADKVAETEAKWDARIAAADVEVHEAQVALAETAQRLRSDRAKGVRDILGLSRPKLAWDVRRPGLTGGVDSRSGGADPASPAM